MMIKVETKYVVGLVLLLVLLALLVLNLYLTLKHTNESFQIDKNTFSYSHEDSAYILPKVYENIITDEESSYIIAQSSKCFTDSTVVGDKVEPTVRLSKTCWLYKSDPKIRSIIQRICELNQLPIENAEDLQVVKYDQDGYYNEHHDSCCDNNQECKDFIKRGGQRVTTMVIYLNDDFEGGTTKFPNLGKEYKPPKNSGILFYPLEQDGTKCHPKALHAGTPVTKGTKYIANVWIRENTFV